MRLGAVGGSLGALIVALVAMLILAAGCGTTPAEPESGSPLAAEAVSSVASEGDGASTSGSTDVTRPAISVIAPDDSGSVGADSSTDTAVNDGSSTTTTSADAATTTAPTTTAPTTAPTTTAPTTTSTTTTAPTTTTPLVETRPEILRLALPTFGGGTFDPDTVAGRPVILWFWGAH